MASLYVARSGLPPQDAVAMLQGVTNARSSSELITIDANGEEEEGAAVADEQGQHEGRLSMMMGQAGQWFGFNRGDYAEGFAAGRADQKAAGGKYADGYAAGMADEARSDKIAAVVAREDQTIADEEVAEQRYADGKADQSAADTAQEDIAKEIALAAGITLDDIPDIDEDQIVSEVPPASLFEDFLDQPLMGPPVALPTAGNGASLLEDFPDHPLADGAPPAAVMEPAPAVLADNAAVMEVPAEPAPTVAETAPAIMAEDATSIIKDADAAAVGGDSPKADSLDEDGSK